MTENNELCPCGSGVAFANCCEPIIKGTRDSETAEELMRARYAAFVTHDIDFIVASTHTHSRKEIDLDFIREWSETSTWRGLEILDTVAGQPGDEAGEVEFRAHYTRNRRSGDGAREEQKGFLHERSHFAVRARRWLYVDGELFG